MDPNETLRRLRELSATPINNNMKEFGELIDNLVFNFEALDEWLSKGGFLPNEWAHGAGRE